MKEKLKVILFSFCSLIAITFDYVKYLDNVEIFKGINSCLKLGNFGTLVVFILLIKLFNNNKKIKTKIVNFLSVLLAFFMVLGASYQKYGTALLVYDSILNFIVCLIVFIGYMFLFKYAISYLYNFLDKYKNKEKSSKIITFFKKHPFIISLIIIVICWLPYLIAFYPIILSPDPSFQIKQFFGIRTKYADYVVLLDDNVVLTNHHPVIHTILLGSCLKIGTMIGNDNLGLFICSVIQTIILSCTLAYTIKYMIKDMKLSSKVGLIALAIYALVPMYGMYAISGVKDVLFTAFIILYLLMLHKLIYYKDKFKVFDSLKLFLIMIMIILFRNNGLFVVILSFPFLILLKKEYRKQLVFVFIVVLVCSTCYSNVLLPSLKITPGSVREALSIPFQQTARYVKYYGDEISEEDKAKIDKILNYDTLAERYDPDLTDDVKNEYNKYATSKDLKEYFKVWFKYLVKRPMVYVDATINNTYGYFYPEKTSWYLHTKFDDKILEDGFNYHYNNLEDYREDVTEYVENFPKIPVLGLFTNIAFNTWIVLVLVGYVLKNKDYKKVILYLPALISILVCIAGPANVYFRYAMPYVFSLPLMISFVFSKKKV